MQTTVVAQLSTARRRFTAKELDYELVRRQLFPPILCDGDRWEATWPAALRAELDMLSPDDPTRTWLEWELALAERQTRRTPGRPFCRVVHADRATH